MPKRISHKHSLNDESSTIRLLDKDQINISQKKRFRMLAPDERI